MNKLTDGSIFNNMTNAELSAWLLRDAQKLDGKPGYNNVAASRLRQAAYRLDPHTVPWLTEGVE